MIRIAGAIRQASCLSPPKYFTAEEVRKILDAVKDRPREHLVVHFLWKTGARAEETLGVRWVDVNFYDKHIRFETLKKSRKKVRGRKPIRKHERIVPVDDELLKELLLWRQQLEEEIKRSKSPRKKERAKEFVFPFGYSRLYKIVRSTVLEAGFDNERAHPHTFRHSFAVHLLKNGVPITVVQRLLGHTSIENTLIYTLIVQQEAEAFVREVRW